MKKIKIAFFIFALVIITAALSVTIGAKYWTDNPFADVKSDAWYYDAVRINYENKIFSGISKTEFGVGGDMTRSMVVTALASASGYDPAQYTATPFKDVPAGAWYAAPVAWADSNKITSGTGGGLFSPNKVITREELVTLLRNYAAFAGYDTEAGDTPLDSFPDGKTASNWAKESLIWAFEKKIVSGKGVGSETYLAPKDTATRVQVAQMMVGLLKTEPVREINGNDISLYRIVYNKDEVGMDHTTAETAEKLAGYFELALGIKPEVVSDESEPTEYEILVGKTNRESLGLVSVDRDSFETDQQVEISVQGNRLVICGIDEKARNIETPGRTAHNIDGSFNAAVIFSEQVLGIDFFNDSTIVPKPDPVISLDDGYRYTESFAFNSRVGYINSGGGEVQLGSSIYYEEWGVGFPHHLGNLVDGDIHPASNRTDANPCYSDPDNIAAVIDSCRRLLEERPSRNLIGLIQNDSDKYCMCERCRAIYREDKSTCGTLIRLCNAVCENLEKDYPNVKVLTWAYNWSAVPPKEGTYLHKNIIICYNTLILCPAHEYSDTTCPLNEKSSEYLRRWGELADELFLWDHTCNFSYSYTPFPDWDTILPNTRYLFDNGTKGVFLNGRSSLNTDFQQLRSYLHQRCYRNPYMSEDEFYYRMDRFLEATYGNGWKNLRKYLDVITELGNHNHFGFYSPTANVYNYDEIIEKADLLDGYFDAAEAGASDDAQLELIKKQRASWTYLKQCAMYEPRYTNGTEAERNAYLAENEELYNTVIKYGISFSERVKAPQHYRPDKSPEEWG